MATHTTLRSLTRVATRSSTFAPTRLSALRPTTTTSKAIFHKTRPFSSTSPTCAKKYTEEHEWIELDAAGEIGTIGISSYAAKALGDVVYVELPEIDTHFNAGDTIGAVESVKSASDIMTPIAGTITATNSALEEKPAHINKDPEGEMGWLARIKVDDGKQVEGLMDEEQYRAFTEE